MITIPIIKSKLKPSDFKKETKTPCDSRWQQLQSEIGARILLNFAKERGNWDSFTKKEIDKFSKHDFWFNKLTSYGDIVEIKSLKMSIKKVKPYYYKNDNYNEGMTEQQIVFKTTEVRYYFTDSFIEEMWRHN